MRKRNHKLIPNKFTLPSHPVNQPKRKMTRKEIQAKNKRLARIQMDKETFIAHYGELP